MITWSQFLNEWQNEVRHICSLIPEERYDETERREAENIVLLRPPSSVEMIKNTENILGIELDDDFRSFYLTSNGWRQYGFDADDLFVSSVDRIRLLISDPQDYVGDVSSYFTGTDCGPGRHFIDKGYIHKSLIVSEICNDGCYIANRRNDSQWEFGIVFF